MTTIRLALRDKAFLFACMYLGGLFVSIFVLGWLVLIGGNPIKVSNLGVFRSTGLPMERFHPGEIAGIRRQVCADHGIAVQFFPALRDSRGFLFPLPGSLLEVQGGCHETTYGFVVPDLPEGEYTYVNTIRFQNNLVGRDETATYPPLRVRIMR